MFKYLFSDIDTYNFPHCTRHTIHPSIRLFHHRRLAATLRRSLIGATVLLQFQCGEPDVNLVPSWHFLMSFTCDSSSLLTLKQHCHHAKHGGHASVSLQLQHSDSGDLTLPISPQLMTCDFESFFRAKHVCSDSASQEQGPFILLLMTAFKAKAMRGNQAPGLDTRSYSMPVRSVYSSIKSNQSNRSSAPLPPYTSPLTPNISEESLSRSSNAHAPPIVN